MLNKIELLKKLDCGEDVKCISKGNDELETFLIGYKIFIEDGLFVFDADFKEAVSLITGCVLERMKMTAVVIDEKPNGLQVITMNRKIKELCKQGYGVYHIVNFGSNKVIGIEHDMKKNTEEIRIFYLCLCEARRLYMKELNELMEMVGF